MVQTKLLSSVLQLVQGDITHQTVDAIVNAANAELSGGGGVDGAIHRAGGPEIMREIRERLMDCPTGSAVITGAGRLQARYVIHAVGPIWMGGTFGEEAHLASAYRTSLELAARYQCRTIAFPSISTGIYDYPIELAAPIAIKTISDFLEKEPVFDLIRFVLFSDTILQAYQSALDVYFRG